MYIYTIKISYCTPLINVIQPKYMPFLSIDFSKAEKNTISSIAAQNKWGITHKFLKDMYNTCILETTKH